MRTVRHQGFIQFGCGLSQFLVYLLLAVFLAGLMTGRTPELFGRKVEAPEALTRVRGAIEAALAGETVSGARAV